jgi:hypothetical protein
MSDSDRRSTRRKRGPRRGSTNRALYSGLTGPVTRGNRGRIAQGFQTNTEDQDGQFEFGQSAKVQAKKSARVGTSGTSPLNCVEPPTSPINQRNKKILFTINTI